MTMGITWGKMKQESLLVSLLYQFLGISTPKNKYMEIVRGIGPTPTNMYTCPPHIGLLVASFPRVPLVSLRGSLPSLPPLLGCAS